MLSQKNVARATATGAVDGAVFLGAVKLEAELTSTRCDWRQAEAVSSIADREAQALLGDGYAGLASALGTLLRHCLWLQRIAGHSWAPWVKATCSFGGCHWHQSETKLWRCWMVWMCVSMCN